MRFAPGHLVGPYEVVAPLGAGAMELVPGQTLAEMLATTGALTPRDAFDVAGQIAEALEAAHEAGIVHRDLQPANIKIRPDGTVKVLDFGLAKGASAGGTDAFNSPTFTTPAMTAEGVILGTAAYMSPEQARGKPVDKRTDIWAFGCVLYEMLTGRVPFPGETVTDVIAAVVTSDPDWTALPASIPPAIRTLLARCLQKDPRARLRDVGDARLEVLDAKRVDGAAARVATPTKRHLPLSIALAAMALIPARGVCSRAIARAGWRTPTPGRTMGHASSSIGPPTR